MNATQKLILATAAVIYGMTAPLPANEPVQEAPNAVTKWYEEVSTSLSQDFTALGVTIENLPTNVFVGVGNWWEETKQFQKDSWNEALKFEQEKKNWATIKGWFAPQSEEVKQ
jgi:hypothetical protein